MPRLNLSQWRSIRTAWEADARLGFAWLTAASGGLWPVSREAIRIHAQRENWRKLDLPQTSVEPDHPTTQRAGIAGEVGRKNPGAEDLTVGTESSGSAGSSAGSPAASSTTPESDDFGDDERARIADKHRREWQLLRGLAYEVTRKAQQTKGSLKTRMLRVVADTLLAIQKVEAEAHGLVVLRVDLDKMSLEELEALARGKMPT